MLKTIIHDLIDLKVLIPSTLMATLLIFIFFYITKRFFLKNKKHSLLASLFYFVFLFYITLILNKSIFSRPQTFSQIDFNIFNTWHYSNITKALIIENSLMLFPFGFSLVFIIKSKFKFIYATILTFLLSLSIETIQLLTARGIWQLEDLICNTLGGFAGALIAYLLILIYKTFSSKCRM